jgi:hypothetical protein
VGLHAPQRWQDASAGVWGGACCHVEMSSLSFPDSGCSVADFPLRRVVAGSAFSAIRSTPLNDRPARRQPAEAAHPRSWKTRSEQPAGWRGSCRSSQLHPPGTPADRLPRYSAEAEQVNVHDFLGRQSPTASMTCPPTPAESASGSTTTPRGSPGHRRPTPDPRGVPRRLEAHPATRDTPLPPDLISSRVLTAGVTQA